MGFLDVLLESRSTTNDEIVELREGETYQDRDRIDQLLQEHWGHRKAWRRSDQEQDRHFIYGEVTPLGVRQLISLMGLSQLSINTNDDGDVKEEVIFYDLGSGAGKLVVQMILEKVVTSATGVELSEARHALAVEAWSKLTASSAFDEYQTARNKSATTNPTNPSSTPTNHRVQFLNQDIVETDFFDATHLYLSSLCFPDKVTQKICETLLKYQTEHSRLKVVAALSDLVALERTGQWKKSLELIQMTWGLSTVRIYKYMG